MPESDVRPEMYRMPTVFGPCASPRRSLLNGRVFDWSAAEVKTVDVTIPVDGGKLGRLLPARCKMLGEPQVSLAFSYMSNLPWLAGRGYNTLGVRTPVTVQAGERSFVGSLLLVLWENKADPIITGREELGVAKIFCDLSALREVDGGLTAAASWEGYQFAKLKVTDTHDVDPAVLPDPKSSPTQGNLIHHRYFPQTGRWGSAAVDEIALTPRVEGGTLMSAQSGQAQLAWTPGSWEQLPTLAPIVDQLADLIDQPAHACMITHVRGLHTDHYDQIILPQ